MGEGEGSPDASGSFESVGDWVGFNVGRSVGWWLGLDEGLAVGPSLGSEVGE